MNQRPALGDGADDGGAQVIIPVEPGTGSIGPHRPKPKLPPRSRGLTLVTEVRRRLRWLTHGLFGLCVVIPTGLAAVYFLNIASDVYIAEARFVVRMPQRTQQPGLVGALLQGSGFQRSQDDAFTVHDYMKSRDALEELNRKIDVRAMFSREDLDVLTQFPLPWQNQSFESLYRYYTRQVAVNYDPNSAITTLEVRAYAADDARRITEGLLTLGEELINQINERARQDLIRYANAEVLEAEKKAKDAAVAVASFRNRRNVYDPDRQGLLQLQQVNRLQDELIATKLQLAQLLSLAPANPQVATLEKRVRGLETEMASEMAKVAGGGSGGGGNAFSDKAGEFERLQLERTFADKQYGSAVANLETARAEARRKQLYLERIVQPNTPDYPMEPRRWRAVLSVFIFSLVAWGALSMLAAGVREHRD